MKFLSVILFVSILFLEACSVSDQEERLLEVYSVSDYDFTLNDQPAISISFGETQNNFCSITLYRSSVYAGYSVDIIKSKNNDQTATINCHWEGKYYVQSSKHDTYFNMRIESLDKENKVATINSSLKLVNPSNGQFFTLDNVIININKNYFDNLVK